jgi:UvrD-like helicase C-terminal domain
MLAFDPRPVPSHATNPSQTATLETEICGQRLSTARAANEPRRRSKRWPSTDARLFYGFGEIDVLVPAHAATIHKSQGSEYPAVIIPVLTQHYPMLQRNLLYTGVTRGKRLVVVVGQKKAVAIAILNASSRRRWSKLGGWLLVGAHAH